MKTRFSRILFIFLSLVLSAGTVIAAPPIKIGALFSVTGPPSFLGEPERNTAQMVVDEINKAGGMKGRMLELVIYDTAGRRHQGRSGGHQADQGR